MDKTEKDIRAKIMLMDYHNSRPKVGMLILCIVVFAISAIYTIVSLMSWLYDLITKIHG